ncbi:MuDR family transposase [Actinidia rufa]|uniref:MuDR family transposase n=1 Tax=Actinidia rufa TaxID=165716 RepID=A0A7J0F8U5_9ERIC|nr:MuDR family transposase [Actinidia rufa]
MAGKKLIAICQSGGEFKTNDDGSLLYRGGDAHAMEIDDQLKYNDFKMEVAEMFNCDLGTIIIKYFLPGNKKTLITISNDKDLKRMINFHGSSDTTDIFVWTEVVAPDVSDMPASRVEQPLSEAVVLVDAPPSVVDDVLDDAVDDTTETDEFLDTSFVLLDDTTNVDAGIDIPTVALRKYAIAHQFAFKYKKNDSHRVTVKCKAEGCPWRIHASRLSTTQLICIKKMNATHTCEGAAVTTGYQATRSWVAGIIKERLKVNSNYKPKDIVNDIKQEYGIQLNYFQAWRGKEIAKEQLQGSYKEAYNQLPFFCEMIMDTNPGSLATFTTKDDSSFHRLFIGPSRMIHLQNVVTVTPPPTRRPPGGRPTTKRFGSQEVVKRQLQCSRCKGAGHNKSTCKQFLLEC